MFNMHRKHGIPPRHHGERPFQKGDLKYIILDLIQEKPNYGYEIIRALEERSGGLYTPSPGAVYPTLQMLEEMGYLSATNQDEKRVYTITDEGHRFLTENRNFAEQIKKQLRHCWNPENIGDVTETMAEFGNLGRLIGRRIQYLDSEKNRQIREIISRAYREIEEIIDRENT